MTGNASGMAAVLDEHLRCEFVAKDVAATMRTMTAEPHLTHVPTLMGGVGRSAVEEFYREHFAGHWPADLKVTPVPRAVGVDQVIGKVAHEQIYWDQACLLVQVGLLDPGKLPVTGVEQALKLRDVTRPMNALLKR